MTRSSPIQHAGLVPRLIEAIEVRGRSSVAGQRSRRIRLAELEPSTIYAALAHELGQRPEAVRQELRRFRLRERTPRAQKVVALVDAATARGWLDAAATGTGAELLVSWCRAELSRQAMVTRERQRKARDRSKGTMERRVQELVRMTFEEAALEESEDELGTVVVAQLVQVVVESSLEELLARWQWWDAGSARRLKDAGSAARTQFHAVATRVAGAWHLQRVEQDETRAMALDNWHKRETASMYLQRAAQLGEARLAQRALRLGIGRGQLKRILEALVDAESSTLSRDDAKRCRELLGGIIFRG